MSQTTDDPVGEALEQPYLCPYCAGPVTSRADKTQACPHCRAPARTRSLPVLLRDHLGDAPGKELRDSLPVLAFAAVAFERTALAAHFAACRPVTLHGNYGEDVVRGVDVRDLSRFDDNSFSGHFSIVLLDYIVEQQKALAEAFRVLAPGGVFATLVLDDRLSMDASPPRVLHKIEKRPGYYEYWPDGVDLLSVGVGRDWLLQAMRSAGFEDARLIAIEDPISRFVSYWFVGRKPERGLVANTLGNIASLFRRRPARPAYPVEKIAAVPECTLCAAPLVAGSGQDDCPSCGAPSRLRGLPLVWDRAVRGETLPRKPLLGFALTGAERSFLVPHFPQIVSVSLYGDYGEGHIAGVDARDLSRFAAGSFSCVFSLLLFDYFCEHEKALAEASRVLAPGGFFITAIMDSRVSDDEAPPSIVKMIKPAPGYFDYVPASSPLPSVHVGSGWFGAAMARAGLAPRLLSVEDAASAQRGRWFVGRKR